MLPDRGRHRRDHAPRPARAAPAGRGRAAPRAAGRLRHHDQGAHQRRAARLAAAAGGGRARRDRWPAGDLRDLAADVDPALPQLLLPGLRRQLRARPLHPGDHRRGDRLWRGGSGDPGRHQAAIQSGADHGPARPRRGGDGGARPHLRPAGLPGPVPDPGPGRAGGGDLLGHGHPAADGRRLPGPGVRPLRHAVQRAVRDRRGGGRPDHPGQRQVLPADRGGGDRLPAGGRGLRGGQPSGAAGRAGSRGLVTGRIVTGRAGRRRAVPGRSTSGRAAGRRIILRWAVPRRAPTAPSGQ